MTLLHLQGTSSSCPPLASKTKPHAWSQYLAIVSQCPPFVFHSGTLALRAPSCCSHGHCMRGRTVPSGSPYGCQEPHPTAGAAAAAGCYCSSMSSRFATSSSSSRSSSSSSCRGRSIAHSMSTYQYVNGSRDAQGKQVVCTCICMPACERFKWQSCCMDTNLVIIWVIVAHHPIVSTQSACYST